MATFKFNADAPVFVPSRGPSCKQGGPHDEDPSLQKEATLAPPPTQSLPEPLADNNLDLIVVSLGGTELAHLQVPSNLPVAELKNLLANLIGVTADGQILVASSSVLEDGVTLEMQGVKASATLTMMFKPHRNVVFLGHIDVGKSTTCGMIMSLSGCVDHQTIGRIRETYPRLNSAWFRGYMRQMEEESAVFIGQAHFATSRTRFTIFDDRFKNYSSDMVEGASQAHIAVLVVSACPGEFETGFGRGGQTRWHAYLALALGVESFIVAINKMDHPSVEWQQTRYAEIVTEVEPFVHSLGFEGNRCTFIPISGLTGANIRESWDMLRWYAGETLMDTFDSHAMSDLNSGSAFRLSMLDGFQQSGVPMACGMLEQGAVKPNTECIIMPTKRKCSVDSVYVKGHQVLSAECGENVTLSISGVTEKELQKGYILCPLHDPLKAVSKFRAQLQIFQLPAERPVMTAGFCSMIHLHTAIEECEILKLEQNLETRAEKPTFVRENSKVTCVISTARPLAVEISVRRLWHFTLRDQGLTIARGQILQLPKEKTDNCAV